jgi:predicted SAM-dependent methyltransferase
MEYEPESVLELGCARSYVLKRLEDAGVRVQGLEISEHCRLTRVIENVTTWDITKTPWPVADKAFDLCLSIAVLEHIPEDKLAAVFAEMERTCKRGLHGIDLHDDDRFDQTHCTIRPQAFWDERLPKDHIGVDKEVLEPKQIVLPSGDGVKLNLGSFTTMFHYGWKNLDIIDLTPWAKHNGYKFSQWDARQGLPYDDGIVDLIFACHMLEHFTYEDGAKLLAECHRALKPGGVMRILVPDAMKLIAGYVKGSLVEFDEMSSTAAARGTQAEKLYELLCAEHKSICDAEKLVAACKAAGFASAKEMPFRKSSSPVMQRETMDLYPDLSLIVEATR